MTMCYLKGATHSDKPTEYYHPNLHFPSALQRIFADF